MLTEDLINRKDEEVVQSFEATEAYVDNKVKSVTEKVKEVSDSIAPQFDPQMYYFEGETVYLNGVLVRFTADYTPDESESDFSDSDSSYESESGDPEIFVEDVPPLATMIPAEANEGNKLADKAWVEEQVNAESAFYITADAAGNTFGSVAALESAEVYYSGGEIRVPTRNDYAIVAPEDGTASRYICSRIDEETGRPVWEKQYDIETNDYEALNNRPVINRVTIEGDKTGEDYGLADLDENGKVKAANLPLSSAVDSDSETEAATPKAVKTVVDEVSLVPAGGAAEWTCTPATYNGNPIEIKWYTDQSEGTGWTPFAAGAKIGMVKGDETSTDITWFGGQAYMPFTAKRTTSYAMKGQPTIPLQIAGDYAKRSDIPSLDGLVAADRHVASGEMDIMPAQLYGHIKWSYDPNEGEAGTLVVENTTFGLTVTVAGGQSGVAESGTKKLTVTATEGVLRYNVKVTNDGLSASTTLNIVLPEGYETLDETIGRFVGPLDTGKADKCIPAANGNIAALDTNGNLVDTGRTAKHLGVYCKSAEAPQNDIFSATPTNNETFANDSLVEGARVCVKFSTACAIGAPKLKVGTSDACPICRYGTTDAMNNAWSADQTVEFVLGVINDNSVWYMLTPATGGTDTFGVLRTSTKTRIVSDIQYSDNSRAVTPAALKTMLDITAQDVVAFKSFREDTAYTEGEWVVYTPQGGTTGLYKILTPHAAGPWTGNDADLVMTLAVDGSPTENSPNLVTSGGVYTVLGSVMREAVTAQAAAADAHAVADDAHAVADDAHAAAADAHAVAVAAHAAADDAHAVAADAHAAATAATDIAQYAQIDAGRAHAEAQQAQAVADEAVAQSTDAVYRVKVINEKIPKQASSTNQLADKDFVNSSIATATATFRGTYNLVTELGLTLAEKDDYAVVGAAIAAHLASVVPPVVADNNDYCFVQIPREDGIEDSDSSDSGDTDDYVRIDRYKFVEPTADDSDDSDSFDPSGSWKYEYSLNNSSFTAAQWAAINSGITSGAVEKLGALPTAEALAQALAGKATKADATLAERGFGEWVCVPSEYDGTPIAVVENQYEGGVMWSLAGGSTIIGDKDSTSLTWASEDNYTESPVTATRTALPGYQLGNDDQHILASEAEAESLRTEVTGKADKPTTSTNNNLAALDANGNLKDSGVAKSDVESLVFAQYYPDGNVKSAAEFTAGIKYGSFDTDNRTVSVLPFCNTGTVTNNSSLVGRVVIPPFVDEQGNGYISDDGTRYMVVGVSGGGSASSNTNLTSIVAPNTVTNIGDRAFLNCTKMTSVSLPAATTVGYNAFRACSSLDSVSLPAATSIGGSAFYYCTSLASVDFGDTPRSDVPSLYSDAFFNVPTSCKIIVPYTQYDAWIAAENWRDLQQEFVRHAEKSDKPATFTEGNLAKFDANGNPTDSGKKSADFATAAQGERADSVFGLFEEMPGSSLPALRTAGFRVQWGPAGYIEFINGGVHFYHPAGQGSAGADYTTAWPFKSGKFATTGDIPDVSGLASKASPATNDNFAALTASGNLKDSGKKPADFVNLVQDQNGNKTAATLGNRRATATVNGSQVSLPVGPNSLAVGENNAAASPDTVATGYGTVAGGYASHAEGNNTQATGNVSHAEGTDTEASGLVSHAEGNYTTAAGTGAHAEGMFAKASGVAAHAEGSNLDKLAALLEAAGVDQQIVALFAQSATDAQGSFSHTEGLVSATSGVGSHAQGFRASDGGKQFSFVWQGYNGPVPTAAQMQALLDDPTSQDAQIALQCLVTALTNRSVYKSKGAGTFCVNPVPAATDSSNDPASGFFVGDQSLKDRTTLTERGDPSTPGFSAWEFPGFPEIEEDTERNLVPNESSLSISLEYWVRDKDLQTGEWGDWYILSTSDNYAPLNATSFTWLMPLGGEEPVPYTGTRTALPGYVLGSQMTKPVASVEMVEDLAPQMSDAPATYDQSHTVKTVTLSDNTCNYISQGDSAPYPQEIVLAFPEPTGSTARHFSIYYECADAGSTEMPIFPSGMTFLAVNGNSSSLRAVNGINIYEFREVRRNVFVVTRQTVAAVPSAN